MIVSPIIDVISMDSFDYMGSSSDLRGGIQFFSHFFQQLLSFQFTQQHIVCVRHWYCNVTFDFQPQKSCINFGICLLRFWMELEF